MNTITHIRKNVLGLSQSEFAAICGVKQPTIHRWEAGLTQPGLDHLAAIRREITARGIEWDDSSFFMSGEAAE